MALSACGVIPPTLVSPGVARICESDDEWVGRLLGGRHRLVARLDEGGMSTVFEGEDLDSGECVAVKVLSHVFAGDSDVRARFSSEMDALGRLAHPNIVQARGAGRTESGEPYLVLDLLGGETLRARLERSRVPLAECLELVDQIASALAAAHAAGIVHRDVKPSNIFLSLDSEGKTHVKLIDFGIWKDLGASSSEGTDSGLIGTPEYMAPEQATGRNDLVDERTDQHALALVTYEMLTRSRPFSSPKTADTLTRVREEPPRPASEVQQGLSRELDSVLLRGLAKAREERYGDVLEFARCLRVAACAVNDAEVAWHETPSDESLERGVANDSTMPSSPLPPTSGQEAPPWSGTRRRPSNFRGSERLALG